MSWTSGANPDASAGMARTRAADFEDKRRGLLESAARVLAEVGPDRASMAQIAARSGVSKALIYHYYPNKDALIFAIVHEHLAALDRRLAEADRPGWPAEERLRSLVGAVLDAYRGADDFHTVQINARRALVGPQRDAIVALERRIVARFSALLREINPALDDRGRPLLTPVTMSLFGILNWVWMWFDDDGPLSREDFAGLATSLIVGGVRSLR